MNSVVGSMNSVFYPCIVKSCDFTVNVQGKKKKKSLKTQRHFLSLSAQSKRAQYLYLSLILFRFLIFLRKKKGFFFFNLKKNLEKGKFLKKSLGPI